ncbi:CK1 family protein kinase [Trichomonas vaginalis G3]|uniref:non-specific serine/threonine protein kinase n=1 Tax=Trichomonas vaginalis (strain ATCC PRA-98 / G3) TaxID=412133 RepID=A2EZM2_TRIV3|nr:protein kinase protein [Trichomonas vaginalis G3]EAY01930.1 CK1 family protein kinase [Trichomonas vaginalis G3]KAI5485300.1 protein kinase protein [Trichomonas vaginalis G3]|eukprot:XP_001330448.1 CK1 family protein kinase [Trichomonas vaginalis G3]
MCALNENTRANRIVLDPMTMVDNYQIINLLGQGGYGDVYKAKNLNDGKYYALKTEYLDAPKKAIDKEITFIKSLNSPYFPKIYANGQSSNFKYAVMDLFGKSISDYKKSLFSKTITGPILIHIGIEMIKAIRAFHKEGYIHRDIKPSNFLFSKNKECPIALIDFGLARKFIDPETNQPIPPAEKPHFGGTKKYVSIRLHEHKDSSFADDLASWFYTMVECWRGRLPWANIRDKDDVGERKKSISPGDLCSSMPTPFRDLYSYIFSLEYYDVPDYDKIISTLEGILNTNYSSAQVNLHELYFRIHKDDQPEADANQPEIIMPEKPMPEPEKTNGCCLLI